MILVNRTRNILFWEIYCLPERKQRGRLLPNPKIAIQPLGRVDLSKAFSQEDLDFIKANQPIPKGSIWLEDLEKVTQPNPTPLSEKDPLTPAARAVINRLEQVEGNNAEVKESLEAEISSEEIGEMQEALSNIGGDLDLPEGEEAVMPAVNVSAEEIPTAEEIAEIEGRRAAQNWRRRQLWVWAYQEGLNPPDFANKRTLWDMIKEHLKV